MDLKIENLKNFTNGYLSSIAKIVDSCVLSFEKNNAFCVASNNDNTVVYYASTAQKHNFINDKLVTLNIPDVKKLIKIFTCIEEDTQTFVVENNNISFKSNYFKFKFHLSEDGIIVVPKININKIFALEFSTNFSIKKLDLQNIIKASSIALDVTKLYIYTEEESVFCDFTDNNRHNVDSIAIKISNEFNGEKLKQPVAINFEIVRLVSSSKSNSLNVKFNSQLGVFLFDLEESGYNGKYVVSALVN